MGKQRGGAKPQRRRKRYQKGKDVKWGRKG